jgi:benzoyl-CoA reductase/2-hydroxyglutaryl-CoA dehydratase subunit BcrC/BadD/HgdB
MRRSVPFWFKPRAVFPQIRDVFVVAPLFNGQSVQKMTDAAELPREERIARKFFASAQAESKRIVDALLNRSDYAPEFDYFIELASKNADFRALRQKAGRRAVCLLCVQVPLELIHAAGLRPFKIFSGSYPAWNLGSSRTPALMCPMLKASLGVIQAGGDVCKCDWVIPTTCDWVIKFPELAADRGSALEGGVFWLELPHLKDAPEGQRRWLDEIYRLKKFLESKGEKIRRDSLARSIELYRKAWRALCRLADMRASGRLASVWFMLVAGTFFFDSVQNWTDAAEFIANTHTYTVPDGERVFLAGSPIFFPNMKLPFLLEEAGLTVVADDLCSSERIFPGAVTYDDTSEFGMTEALAARYHRACLCPTFIDNDRRINNILARGTETPFGGVVFHVLKGCHPYDIESQGLEARLKERGLRFIRVEADYASGDDRNLFTRLEAFRNTMRDGPRES